MNISLLLGLQVATRALVYRLKYLQTKKKNKFVKISKFFYIEILYCSLCSPDFALLHQQNLGKKFLAPSLTESWIRYCSPLPHLPSPQERTCYQRLGDPLPPLERTWNQRLGYPPPREVTKLKHYLPSYFVRGR